MAEAETKAKAKAETKAKAKAGAKAKAEVTSIREKSEYLQLRNQGGVTFFF